MVEPLAPSALGSAYSTNIPPLYQPRSSPISQNIVNSRLSHQGSLNEHFLSQHQPDYGNPLPDRTHLAQQNIMPYISSQRFLPSSHLNYQSVTPIGHQPLDQNIAYQPQVALSRQHVGTTFDNNQIRARHSSPQYEMEVFRAQLKSRLRTKGESLSSLAQNIKKLVRKAYPQASPEMKDKFAKESFIDALNDQDLEWTIFQGHPSSLQKAIRLAHEYEAFKLGRGRRCSQEVVLDFSQWRGHLLIR